MPNTPNNPYTICIVRASTKLPQPGAEVANTQVISALSAWLKPGQILFRSFS